MARGRRGYVPEGEMTTFKQLNPTLSDTNSLPVLCLPVFMFQTRNTLLASVCVKTIHMSSEHRVDKYIKYRANLHTVISMDLVSLMWYNLWILIGTVLLSLGFMSGCICEPHSVLHSEDRGLYHCAAGVRGQGWASSNSNTHRIPK